MAVDVGECSGGVQRSRMLLLVRARLHTNKAPSCMYPDKENDHEFLSWCVDGPTNLAKGHNLARTVG
jgi:hypothetical protein